MANTQVGNNLGIPANAGKNINGGDDANTGWTNANIITGAALRARLTAISAASYSSTRLDAMTYNDMVYAVRVHDDLASVN